MRRSVFAVVTLILHSSFFTLHSWAQQAKEWSLSDCVEYALAHNINIKQQENNVKQQEVLLSTSKNSRLPDLNGGISENFSFGRALTSDNTYMNRNTQSTGFSLSTGVPVFTAGRIPADIKVHRLNLQAALQDFEYARESVMLGVATSFLEAVCQKDMVEVAERQVELSQVQVRRMELLYENDKVSEADLSQIRSTLANDELSLTQQRNRYMLALLDLSQLLELESPDDFDVARPLIDSAIMTELPSPDLIYNEALGVKPQIQAEQIRLQSAQKSVLVAKSAFYPTLYFNAGLGSSYYKTSGFEAMSFGRQLRDNFNQYFGASISVPIFNRFATRNGVRSARLQVNAQQMRLEQAKKSLYKEIQQAYYNAVAAIRQCESSDVALSSASTSFDLMQRKYENGKATLADYQDAKTKYMLAESQQIQSRYTWLFRRKILDFYRGVTF
ncbi:MAG: TolC family protein [Bacteroidaceae bacterium]|nr:TolC family protein [Bacteroidaceae bacterium]